MIRGMEKIPFIIESVMFETQKLFMAEMPHDKRIDAYDRLKDWCVNQINECIKEDKERKENDLSTVRKEIRNENNMPGN